MIVITINRKVSKTMNINYNYEHLYEDITAARDSSNKAISNEFHLHNSYEIYLFLDGDVNYFVEQSFYKLQKGNLLIFNSNEIHKAVILTDMTYERIVIHFKPEAIEKFCTKTTNLLACFQNRATGQHNITLLDNHQINCFTALTTKLIDKLGEDGYGSDALAFSYLIELLVMVNDRYLSDSQTTANVTSPKIKTALEYIEVNLTKNLSLDHLSKSLSINKYYLSHIFKKETGSTLYQYILMKRISLAKQFLISGSTVTEACYQSGFNDYSNFIRTFKKITGFSPGYFKSK